MILPPDGRLLRFLFRDRDFDDLIDVLSSLWLSLRWHYIAPYARPKMWPSDVLATNQREDQTTLVLADAIE